MTDVTKEQVMEPNDKQPMRVTLPLGYHLEIRPLWTHRQWGFALLFMFGGHSYYQIFNLNLHLVILYIDIDLFRLPQQKSETFQNET